MEANTLSLLNLVPNFSEVAHGNFTTPQGISSIFVLLLLGISIVFLLYAVDNVMLFNLLILTFNWRNITS